MRGLDTYIDQGAYFSWRTPSPCPASVLNGQRSNSLRANKSSPSVRSRAPGGEPSPVSVAGGQDRAQQDASGLVAACLSRGTRKGCQLQLGLWKKLWCGRSCIHPFCQCSYSTPVKPQPRLGVRSGITAPGEFQTDHLPGRSEQALGCRASIPELRWQAWFLPHHLSLPIRVGLAEATAAPRC